MRRVFLGLAAALVLFLVGRAIVRAVVSDETKIRWMVEDMQEGFDRTRMDPILVAFAENFRDETSGADRSNVREALAYLFLTAKHPETKAFPYRVEVEITKLAIDEDSGDEDSGDEDSGGEPGADCELAARFFDLRAGSEDEPEVAWEIAIVSRWERGEYGWRIARTSYATKSGRMLR